MGPRLDACSQVHVSMNLLSAPTILAHLKGLLNYHLSMGGGGLRLFLFGNYMFQIKFPELVSKREVATNVRSRKEAKTRTVKVNNLSPKATERDIHDFFSFSGEIEQIHVQSNEDGLKVAFVTFKDPEALDTAVLLSGATIVDQIVNITEVEDYHPSSGGDSAKEALPVAGATGIGGAVTRAQDVISTMLAKGYDLGKDAMNKAKTFDEKHQLSANATATVSSLDKKMGLTQKFSTGTAVVNEHVKAIDEKYQVSEKTRSAFVAAEQKMSSAGSSLMKNKYIFTSATWVSGAFNKVTKAAGEVSQKALEKVYTSGTKQDAPGPHSSG